MTTRRFLLDTNVVIGLARGPGAARDLLDESAAAPSTCAISQITRIELFSLATLTTADIARLHEFISPFEVLLLNEAIEQATVALRRSIRLKLPDAVIAATATVHGLTLLTLDDRLSAAVKA
jgi:predicted nucleic acid-binding protein